MQQLTGRPAIGSGDLSDECKAWSFFERRLESIKMKSQPYFSWISNLPTRGYEDDNSNNNRPTNSSTSGNGNLIHIRCLCCYRTNFTTLCVRHIFRCDGNLLEWYYTNNNTLLIRNILDLKFTLRWLEWWSLLEGLIAKETINNSKSENVCCVRVPLNNDWIIWSTKLFSFEWKEWSFTWLCGKNRVRLMWDVIKADI